ncbi:MAG: YchJ family metal-binding protein [Phormidesmis sp.]
MALRLCPCGSQKAFANCCEPYLTGQALAPTAEALMRSRYSAFYEGNLEYLINSHAGDAQADDRSSLRKSVNSTQWTNLIIISRQKGQAKDKTGVVEFAAAYRPKALLALGQTGQIEQLHERSRFIKQGEQWLYTDGDRLPLYQPKQTQPCWCGSGKRFKQCHG